jgi:glycosyltransferase involved in cell wall biosynthesis
VHVVGQLWEGAEKEVEEKCAGRLIIHRVPFEDWTSFRRRKLRSTHESKEARGLFQSDFPPQCFSWEASLLVESLVEQEGIDVIEAQEYEAPLYYLQLRRALGLGPKRRPPCIVHLHSPTEFIVRYNDEDIAQPCVLTSKRYEDYSIAAADALLCPSCYLARQAEAHYGLAEGSIQVIPYPIGNSSRLERDDTTWTHGTICYVGRLERRKGVIEWIDAAVAVAHDYPTAHFEFIGANVLGTDGMSGEEFVEHRIPVYLRRRFHFRGEQKRAALPQFLAHARLAVVPSRWENFPNTCIEAMCSGLPVIASRQGGMVEMVQDGRTGWLASKAGSEGLAEALRRALETSPMTIAAMGREASADIRKLCDNQKIVESHIDFRRQVAQRGSERSLHLPANLSRAKKLCSERAVRQKPQNSARTGLAVVVTCCNTGPFLAACLQSLQQQTQKLAAAVVVDDGSTEEQTLQALNQARQAGWQVIQQRLRDPVAAKNAGIQAILSTEPNPLGFSFLSAEDRLQPGFVAACTAVLQRCSEVGLVSCWTQRDGADGEIWIRPCPSFPYQWLSNELTPFSVVRTEALHEVGNFRPVMSQGYEAWDLFNAVMAADWVAVTIPEILGSCQVKDDPMPHLTRAYAYGRMRRELLERFPELIARDAKEIVLLTESNTARLLYAELWTRREQLATVRTALRHPRGTALQVLRKMKNKILYYTPAFISKSISRIAS